MDTVQPIIDARSRKTLTLLLQALASRGQRAVAESIGVSETTMSRMKDNDFERIARALTALGFKVVPVTARCVSAERAEEIEQEFETLRKLARRGLDSSDISFGPDEDTGFHV